MNKPIFSTFIILWASLDLPTLAGMLVFSSGLALAAYIWVRWGSDVNHEVARKSEFNNIEHGRHNGSGSIKI